MISQMRWSGGAVSAAEQYVVALPNLVGTVLLPERLLGDPDQALEGRAVDRWDAEQVRQLADRDRHREPDDEAGHDRDRQELRQEAQSCDSGHDEDVPTISARPALNAMYDAGSRDERIAPTTEADRIATEELVVTLR